MSYHGDIRLGDTIDIKFTTRAFASGVPTTLAGTPSVAAYVGNGTTEITAGITLTVDFDSRTGLNNVRVVATSGNGYATATNVELVITAGTVGGTSVVGEVVGSFSIENRSAIMPTTAARTLDVSAGGEAGVDWANIGSPTTSVNLSGTSTKAVEPTVAGRTLDVSAGGEAGLDWANIGSPTTAQNLSGTSTKALEPTTAGRTLDVTATGEAGLDWANIGSPTTVVNLSGTTVKTATDVEADTQDIQSRLPAALTAGGKIKASMDEILAVAQSATDLKDFADTGYDPATHKVAEVVTVDALTANNDKTGYALTAAYDSAKTAAQAGDQMDLVNAPNATALAAIADKFLARAIAGGADGPRSVSQALAMLRNKSDIVAGVLTVYEDDDSTPLWEANVTTAAGNPLASVSPTT